MKRFLTKGALTGVLVSTALMATACPDTAPVYGGPPTGTRTFKANSVTVNSNNDGWNITCFCTKDEPKVVNIGFRVKLGVANSASATVGVGDNHWNGLFEQGLSSGGSHTFSTNESGAVTFSNVALPDLLDLAQGAPIEIAGAWAWKVKDDGLLAASVNNFANSLASAITGALNSTLANTNAPADPNFLVNTIITALTGTGNFFGQFATTLTNLLNAFNISSDDITGSAFYVGVGSSGALGGIVDGVTSGVAFPAVAIPAVVVPPDIGGGSVFSLGTGTKNFTNSFTNGSVDGQYTVTYTFG